MSTLPNYSINYYAPLASGAAVSVGQVMLPNSTDGSYYVVATAANRGSRRSYGVAISAWNAATNNIGTFRLQQDGILPASISGLAAGSASWVRCSATGTIERFTPSGGGSSDIIGKCEADGSVHLEFGIWTEDLAVGGGGGSSLSGTTNGLLALTGANAGTADTYWQRPADGILATNYVDNGVSDVGHITIIGNGETYAGASKPLDGFIRLSTQLADGPTHASNIGVVVYQSTTLGTDPWVLGVSGGKPVFGDPSHLTEVDVMGDGVFIDAGAGGAGTMSSFTGEIRLQLKTAASAGGFSVSNFSFHSGGPLKGVASYDGGSPNKLRTSIGTGLQVLRTNAGATDIEWATISNPSLPLSVANGGTGADNSAATGLQKYSAGTGSVATLVNADVASNAAIAYSKLGGSGTESIGPQEFDTTIDTKGTGKYREPVHIQTTDATVTTLDSFTLASNTTAFWTVMVVAQKSGVTQGAAYSVSAAFRNNAGTVAQIGTTQQGIVLEDDAAWDCTIDNSTTTIRLRVTGKAATTIQWSVISSRVEVIS